MKRIKLQNVKKILRGASSLYSKRPELYFNKLWPNFFNKSKNVYLWDLNGKKYLDFIFAVGTNTLGYSNPKINNALIKSIKQGNMTTLNCPEEYLLAKELLNIQGVRKLSLGYNKLTGTIPISIGNARELRFLSLENNELEGQLPKSMELLSAVQTCVSVND